MKRSIVSIWILVCLVLSMVPVFVSPSPASATITVDSYGAGRNDTGEPIGGGENFTLIVDNTTYATTYVVTDKAGLESYLVGGGSEASAGECIFIPGATAIDMSGEEGLYLPDGVILASDRGESGSDGGRIYTDSTDVGTFLYIGDDCRVSGLRIEGPSGATSGATGWGVGLGNSDNVQIDNCEIYDWPEAGIWMQYNPTTNRAFIYCNYIHNCRLDGYGYGVAVLNGNALIQCNEFDYCRHAIMGQRGTPLTNYEAIYNVVGSNCTNALFDCHGGSDTTAGGWGPYTTGQCDVAAGGTVLVHYNTFEDTSHAAVQIRGVPSENCTVHHNWVYHSYSSYTEFQVFYQRLSTMPIACNTPYIDMYVGPNAWGSDRDALKIRTGTSDYPSSGTISMPTQEIDGPVPPEDPDPYIPPDPEEPDWDESITTATYSTYNYYDSYLYKSDESYETAHDATSATGVDYTGTYLKVGQTENVTGEFSIFRGELQFDTTYLDTQTEIEYARVFLWCKSDSFGGSANVTVVKGSQFNSPPVTADYGYYTDLTQLGTIVTSAGVPTDTYSYITLNTEGLANIVRGGITKFGLIGSTDISETEPSSDEYGEFWTMESSHPPYLEITYSEVGLGPPNFLEIKSAKVYYDYNAPGDQLYVMTYKVVYNSGDPDQISEDYFRIRLFDTDGTTLKAEKGLPEWGYGVASFYLSANSKLPVKQKYVIKISGVSGRFTPQVEVAKTLGTTSDTWQGLVSGNNFRKWVIAQAKSIQKYYDTTLVESVAGVSKLNDEGSTVFLRGIEGLDSVRPDLFMASEQKRDWGELGEYDPAFRNKLLNNMGSQMMTAFENIGQSMGLSGTWVNSGLWGFFTICVAITGLSAGFSIAGLGIGIPAFMLGLFMGIPPVIGAILAIVLMFLLARTLWAARG